jgi:hypothetical protein
MEKYTEKQEKLTQKWKKAFLETVVFEGSADIGLGVTFQIYNYINGLDLRQVFGHKKIKFFCTTTIHGLFHVPSRLSK